MIIAIISDIHANLPALDAVLRDVDHQNITQIYCLGDIVGYNSYPIKSIQRLQERRIPAVHGNHDLMVIDTEKQPHGGHNARAAIAFTRQTLMGQEKQYMAALPGWLRIDKSYLLVHSALDNPFVYRSRLSMQMQ